MSSARQSIGVFAIGLWALAMLAIVSSLMVGHWVTLPKPTLGTEISVVPLSGASHRRTEIVALHVLYSNCPCSRRVLKSVLQRGPIDGATERIVLVGDSPSDDTTFTQAGFEVDEVTPQQLKSKYGLESAPLLVVTGANGVVLYSGGYTSRKQGLDYRDREVIENALVGKSTDSVPVFGCAVSDRLKAITDPFGLKQ